MNDFEDFEEDEQELTGKYVPGTLYFMQETDYLSGQKFEYYKIGIVRNDKEVVERESEHRTGNPRQISSIKDISAPAVQRVETYMHNYLAAHRVSSGEWFYLPGDLLTDAINEAQRVADLVASEIEGLAAIPAASKASHAGAAIPASGAIKSLVEDLLRLEVDAKALTKRKSEIAKQLKDLAGQKPEYAYLFKRSESKDKKAFNGSLMKAAGKDMAELYDTFLVEGAPSWKYSILIKVEHVSSFAELPDLSDLGPLDLHQLYLDAWSHEAVIKLSAELTEAKLLSAIGEAAAVENLLEWTSSAKRRFDGKAFKAAHPDLHEKFQKVTPGSVTQNVAEWASYVNA